MSPTSATPPSSTTGLADDELPPEISKVGSVLQDAAHPDDRVTDHVHHVGTGLHDAAGA